MLINLHWMPQQQILSLMHGSSLAVTMYGAVLLLLQDLTVQDLHSMFMQHLVFLYLTVPMDSQLMEESSLLMKHCREILSPITVMRQSMLEVA